MSTDIAIRIVLMEKYTKNYFPYRNVYNVKKTWVDSKHPKKCTGFCKLQNGVFSVECTHCGYDTI